MRIRSPPGADGDARQPHDEALANHVPEIGAE